MIARRQALPVLVGAALVVACASCKSDPSKEEAPPPSSAMAQQIAATPVGEEREVEEGVFMLRHRVGATDLLGGGWHRARSTEGGFSVEMPIAFADFRVRSDASDGVEVRSHTVGSKTPGLLSWSATCIARRDGSPGPGAPPAGDHIEAKGTPTRAYQRTIVLGDRLCVLVVEAQGTDPLPPEADRQRFLTSFQSTGAVTW